MNPYFNKHANTIVWIAPFYNRSGYGVGARAAVIALHKLGCQIRILSVDQVEPGLDDTDIPLLKSLENTPIKPPVTTIISHVPSHLWLKLNIPEPDLRIISTTFDGHAQGSTPPPQWMEVFERMDQIWLESYKEIEVFIAAGISAEKLKLMRFPHHWKENHILPPVRPENPKGSSRFRFLSIAMFQPRRRWDALIEAFLEEFKDDANVELYLKVNYPCWHPVPGKPQRDLRVLVETLKQKTNSKAQIIIDEELGVRTDITNLIDDCNVYVSTDTTPTAPVGEARVRKRLVVVPDGLFPLSEGEYIHLTIPADPGLRIPMTEEMLQYQPHHRGTELAVLRVEDVRATLRQAYTISEEEKARVIDASEACVMGPAQAIPIIESAIEDGWRYKIYDQNQRFDKRSVGVVWEGSQFVYHSLALCNRESCVRLIDAGCNLSVMPYEKDQFEPGPDSSFQRIKERFDYPLDTVDVHIRHQWPPKLTPPRSGRWVVMQPWEYGSLPKEWIKAFASQVDEVWAPSAYVRDVFIESGMPADRVVLIHYGVDPAKFHPDAPPYPLKTRKKFKFLFIGGTLPRKGIDALLDVYTRTFSVKDDVCLVIKDMGGETFYKGINQVQRIQSIIDNSIAPEIEYITSTLEEKDLIGLYTACDVLVHPYRGEGFGLTVLESMACGTPAIVTNGGACLEFCNENNSYLIDANIIRFKKKSIQDLELMGHPWLYEPSKESLQALMLDALKHPEKRKELGEKAREHAHTYFNWDIPCEFIQHRIRELIKKPVYRNRDDALSCEYADRAAAAIEEAEEAARKQLEARRDYAEELLNNAEYAKAVKALGEILREYPEDIPTLLCMGRLSIKIHRMDEARIFFRKVLSIEPENETAGHYLANLKNMAKEPSDR